MTIQRYEDWMRPQVVALFNAEYGVSDNDFDSLFLNFYDHPFQRGKCIRIVALDEKKVAGFQSFFYWPVTYKGRLLNSFQSGNSLVHPAFRGQGLFAKMLNFIHEPGSGFDFDVLIGFPVEASYNSFIRNKWINPFNLQWYVKPMNPLLSLFSSPEKSLAQVLSRERVSQPVDKHIVAVTQTTEWDEYRFAYQSGNYYRYIFRLGDKSALFELKAQVRKRIIREMIIGKFLPSHSDEQFIRAAFAALEKEIRKNASFTLLSIAINPLHEGLRSSIEMQGFKRIDRHIHFIAKGPLADTETNWDSWWMFRSDIDTW